MPKGFYDPEIEPACGICACGRLSADGEHVLCLRKGIMLPSSSCSRFRYDPFKRKPQKPNKLPEFNADDFSL